MLHFKRTHLLGNVGIGLLRGKELEKAPFRLLYQTEDGWQTLGEHSLSVEQLTSLRDALNVAIEWKDLQRQHDASAIDARDVKAELEAQVQRLSDELREAEESIVKLEALPDEKATAWQEAYSRQGDLLDAANRQLRQLREAEANRKTHDGVVVRRLTEVNRALSTALVQLTTASEEDIRGEDPSGK